MVESIARVRHIRVTPQKARRVVDMIRGKQALEAHAAGDMVKARALCAQMKEKSMTLVGMLDQLLELPCGHA